MSENPPLWGRMFARLQGEVPATTLEAYRRASLPVFELLDQVAARRLAAATDGLDPWTIPPATRAEFLCAWNAFVLQTLGNDILDADFARYPATAGYVPPVTADQVLAFYEQVEGWLNRAHQARANPDYRLDVEVPAELPPWVDAEPCPDSHLEGMLRAMRAVGEHAAAAVAALPQGAPDPEQQAQLNRIRQLHASAETKARYAADLYGTRATAEVHERMEPHAREAIELFYLVGQLAADPALALPKPAKQRGGPASKRSPGRRLPGQPGFDEWCLTDPDARGRLEEDRRARKAIRRMWKEDPDPARTLEIHAQIQAALDRGDVAHATSGTSRIGHFYRCPWGPVFVARRAVTLGGIHLRTLQQFVYDVGVEGNVPGEPFRRAVATGVFRPTEQMDYGAPAPTRKR